MQITEENSIMNLRDTLDSSNCGSYEVFKPRILVFGVGGGGVNAVNSIIEADLRGVDFAIANTDYQSLE
ncbi:MAG: hypothetical protein LBS34_00815, partial [Rickettsiales bacterium]|nr:hypothetical protein [Rickettsiales bacterium]